MPQSPPCDEQEGVRSPSRDEKNRWRLRGLIWRMQLGVLPSHFDSVDALRRASADGRRRYADLRRKLLVDPHLMEEGQKPPDVGMDNPLSLDPDSVWGKYFRNAEIERIIDKDLSRLYPEHGDFFQSVNCQAMLRRVLLVWSLIHPQLSYRQGMHELLAPLLYVLHVDVVNLCQVKKKYEDLFDDRFDEDVKMSKLKLPFDLVEGNTENGHGEVVIEQELNLDMKVLIMGSDTYGAEGELGALFSARFMEHDAYCMFDALLSGRGGAMRMSEYFAVSGVPDASAALYRTLAAADMSLYAHFIQLGVQPQYFALRWLRLLFGREFVLEDLLLVWDAIFSASNDIISPEEDDGSGCIVSPRSALISSIAVTLLLQSRPALLAAPDATGCLQRLLSSPHIPDIRTFVDNAKLLQPLAEEAARTPPPPVAKNSKTQKTSPAKSGSLRHQRSSPCSAELLKMFLAEGYWEGKWRTSVLEKAEQTSTSNGDRQARRKSTAASKSGAAAAAAASAAARNEQEEQLSGGGDGGVAGAEAYSSENESSSVAVSGSPTPTPTATAAKQQPFSEVTSPSNGASAEYIINREMPSAAAASAAEHIGAAAVAAAAPLLDDNHDVKPVAASSNRKRDDDSRASASSNRKRDDDSGEMGGRRDSISDEVKEDDHESPPPPLPRSSSSSSVRKGRGLVTKEKQLKEEQLKEEQLKEEQQLKEEEDVKKVVRLLGRSMGEHIQVLEAALSAKARGRPAAAAASSWIHSNANSNVRSGGDAAAASLALAELRRISDALLRM